MRHFLPHEHALKAAELAEKAEKLLDDQTRAPQRAETLAVLALTHALLAQETL